MKATIERVIWEGKDGWNVLALRNDEKSFTATGYLTNDIKVGSCVDLTGEWIPHPKYGLQFKIATVVAVMPSTSAGIEKWLASGSVGNVGEVMARRICQHFGDETPGIIQNTPERIIEVAGIGKKRVAGLLEGLKGNQATRKLIEWLGPHGVSMGMINKLIRAFSSPDDAMYASKLNPYQTLNRTELPFSTIDKIALADDMPYNDPRRMNAVAKHVIGQDMRHGHCYMTRSYLLDQMQDYLKFPTTNTDWIDGGLIETEHGIYLKHIKQQEERVDTWLRAAVHEDSFLPDDEAEELVKLAFMECTVEPSPKQFEAVLMTGQHRACVITGGPGTGKTTIIQALVHLAENCNQTIRLMAPTGRAQLRLGNVCGREASTIHKALIHEEEFPEDIIVIDEMSMVDLELMDRLTDAIKRGGRLVMVGDYNQLPSVGPGNVLKDVIDSGIVPVVRLDTIFRQAQKSEIILNAHRIIAGRNLESGGDTWLDYMEPYPDEQPGHYGERVEQRIVQVVADIMGADDKFNPFTEIQVLLPMYKHHPSIDAINVSLQDRLNPLTDKKQFITWGRLEFRQGDKVMQTKNNYDIDVFNGEIGVILGATEGPKRLMVEYPGGRIANYDAETIPELKLAYAVSIHKSQGSEYPCVVIGLSKSHFIMLQRNLLYTALTRASKQCTIVGDRQAVEIAIKNDKPIYRQTRLLK